MLKGRICQDIDDHQKGGTLSILRQVKFIDPQILCVCSAPPPNNEIELEYSRVLQLDQQMNHMRLVFLPMHALGIYRATNTTILGSPKWRLLNIMDIFLTGPQHLSSGRGDRSEFALIDNDKTCDRCTGQRGKHTRDKRR